MRFYPPLERRVPSEAGGGGPNIRYTRWLFYNLFCTQRSGTTPTPSHAVSLRDTFGPTLP
jgi:hypothetical protein